MISRRRSSPRMEKLREIKRSLQAHGAEIALLSGSGATVFGVFADEARARLAQAQFVSEKCDERVRRSHLFRPARLAVRTTTDKPWLG